MKIRIHSLRELSEFARKIAATLKGGEVLALVGQLGAGKTAFTKLLLKHSGVRKRVASPTFVLMVPYRSGAKTFYHLDLYRTKSYAEAAALGIEDLWGKRNAVFAIEWADKIRRKLPKGTITLKFKIKTGFREIEITGAPKELLKMLG